MARDCEGPAVAFNLSDCSLREVDTEDPYEDLIGLLMCLEGLSPTNITVGQARAILKRRKRKGIRTLVCVYARSIIGTCSLIIEQKLIHGGGLAGHLEDVAVLEKYQGNGVGKMLIQAAIGLAQAYGCYKIILDCDATVAPFYQKSGFSHNGQCMRLDLTEG